MANATVAERAALPSVTGVCGGFVFFKTFGVYTWLMLQLPQGHRYPILKCMRCFCVYLDKSTASAGAEQPILPVCVMLSVLAYSDARGIIY